MLLKLMKEAEFLTSEERDELAQFEAFKSLSPKQKQLIRVALDTNKSIEVAPQPSNVEMLKDIADRFNKYFEIYNYPFRVTLPELTYSEIEVLNSIKDKTLWDNEIESSLIITLESSTAINALLPVQSGKSKTAILVTIFERVLAYFEGKKCEFFIVVPCDKSIEKTTKTSYVDLYRLIGNLHFEKDGQSVSFFKIAKSGESDRDNNGSLNPRIHALTTSKEVEKNIANYRKQAEENGARLIVIWDEAHYAENKDSVADKNIGDLIANLIKSPTNQKLVCVSATPFPYCEIKGMKELELKVGKNYFGFNCWRGKLIDPNGGFNTPNFASFSMMQKKIGLMEIPIMPAAFSNKKLFDALNLHMTQQDYFDECCKQIAEFIRYDKNNGGTGALLRFINSNPKTEEILNKLKSILPEMHFMRYFGKVDWEDIKTELRQSVHNEKEYCVIIVSRRARMSNNIPKEVNLFIDCTPNYTTITSAIQGLCGRAACYGLQRDVILSDDNYQIIMTYIETKGDFTDKRLRRIIRGMKLHSRTNIIYDDEEDDDVNEENTKSGQFAHTIENSDTKAMKLINLMLGHHINRQKGNKRLVGTWIPYSDFDAFLNMVQPFYPGVVFLRKGEIPHAIINDTHGLNETEKKYRKYHLRTNNDGVEEIFISFRNTKPKPLYSGRDKEIDLDGMDEEERNISLLQNPDKLRGIEPHLHVTSKHKIKSFIIAFLKLNNAQDDKTEKPKKLCTCAIVPISTNEVDDVKKASTFGDYK